MIDTIPNTKPVEHEVTTRIKPSEAIRLGRLQYPNVIARVYIDPKKHAACTVGAMMAGYGFAGGYHAAPFFGYVRKMFPEMPRYVREKIQSIPTTMDYRSTARYGNGFTTLIMPEHPAQVEESLIRALEAMGY